MRSKITKWWCVSLDRVILAWKLVDESKIGQKIWVESFTGQTHFDYSRELHKEDLNKEDIMMIKEVIDIAKGYNDMWIKQGLSAKKI